MVIKFGVFSKFEEVCIKISILSKLYLFEKNKCDYTSVR